MKIDYIHVGDKISFARYDVKHAADAFEDILHTHENPNKTLSVVYKDGSYLELKVLAYHPPENPAQK